MESIASQFAKILPPSLWAATAQPRGLPNPLDSSRRVDVAIVGAGYTGLSTALHLSDQGLNVCVLDSNEPGWGASGRNGGLVIPGLKYDPDELSRRFGQQIGQQLVELAGGSADTVFGLIERHNISCDATRNGWIQPAHSTTVLPKLYARAQQWESRGACVELLDRTQVSKKLGTDGFIGGWLDKRAGSVQPLSYARGLARAAMSRGVEIYSATHAAKLEQYAHGWRIHTAHGPWIEAKQVLIATNGYTDTLFPGLARTIIAANSFLVATRPLGSDLGQNILPGREVASDSRRLLLYFRRDADGRLLMGGRGPFRDPRNASDWSHLERSVRLLFPALSKVDYEYRWSGRIAITRDFLPHVHLPAPGLTLALGYNGRGIAMATTFGKHLAAHLLGAAKGLPLPPTSIKPIPLHTLQRFYISAGVAWYGLLDALS